MAFSIKNLLGLFYPRLCAHCKKLLPLEKNTLCVDCFQQISFIDPQGRCRTCFAELGKGNCERCIKRSVAVHKQLAACEAYGPAQTLLTEIQLGRPENISAAGSLMAYRWLELKLPLPDMLIPLPCSFWHKQKWGFDPQRQLALEMGKIFSTPVQIALRKVFDRSHFLTHGEFRHKIQISNKAKASLCDKNILLVAPLLDDALLRSAGEALKALFPAQIQALAFASYE